MSSLSQFAPFAGGGLKSYQTGYVSATPSDGSGEDTKFFDVTVSSVSTSKTMCSFAGSGSTLSGRAMAYYSQNGAEAQAILSARMTSNTNLRLATSLFSFVPTVMTGRWQLAEAN
jgi:hypothetical protein